MGAAQIVALVLAIARAIPIVDGWVKALVETVNGKIKEESKQARATMKQELKSIDRAIQKAENDTDIKNLSITRRRLKSGWLS